MCYSMRYLYAEKIQKHDGSQQMFSVCLFFVHKIAIHMRYSLEFPSNSVDFNGHFCNRWYDIVSVCLSVPKDHNRKPELSTPTG